MDTPGEKPEVPQGGEEGGERQPTPPPPPAAARKPWEATSPAPSPSPAGAKLPEPADPREDQVQNAVAFLSHPKVRSSSAESKRAFLQKKGLTAAEIDEAFKRVPAEEPPSPPAYDPQAAVPSPPQPIAGPQPLKVVLGAASATTLVYVAKNLLEPYRYRILHALSRAVAPREDKEAEMRKEQPAASAELQKCVQALETSTTRICSAVEGLTAKLDSPARQGEAQQRMEAVLRDLQGAIKSLPSVVQKDQASPPPVPDPAVQQQMAKIQAEMASLMARQRPLGAGAASGQTVNHPPRPLGSAVEKTYPLPSQILGGSTARVPAAAFLKGKDPIEEASDKPASYQEVLQMLQEGRTPPNVRTDIQDEPPDPYQNPTSSSAVPRRKPWERAAGDERQAGGVPSPPWQRPPPPAPFGGSGASGGSLSRGSAASPAAAAGVAPGGRPALIEEIRQLAAQERLERGGPAGQPSVAGVLGSGGIPVASGVGGVGLGPAEAAAAWQPPAKPKPTIPPSGTQASPTQPPTTALQTSGGNDGGRDSEDAAASIARPVLVPETMSIEEIQSSGAESGGGGAGVALGPFSE